VENSLFHTLFALLFIDVIFDPTVPDAFLTRFQVFFLLYAHRLFETMCNGCGISLPAAAAD